MTQPLLIATLDNDMAPVTEGAVIGVAPKISRTRKGTISEKLFEAFAMRRGWDVATNSGGGDDFDHIIKRPEHPCAVVIQTRFARPVFQSGTWRYGFKFCKPDGSLYAPTAFHVFAVHLSDIDQFVFWTRLEAGNRKATTYTLPEFRKKSLPLYAMADRDPNNWELLDDVAQSLTNSGGRTANVLDPQ